MNTVLGLLRRGSIENEVARTWIRSLNRNVLWTLRGAGGHRNQHVVVKQFPCSEAWEDDRAQAAKQRCSKYGMLPFSA